MAAYVFISDELKTYKINDVSISVRPKYYVDSYNKKVGVAIWAQFSYSVLSGSVIFDNRPATAPKAKLYCNDVLLDTVSVNTVIYTEAASATAFREYRGNNYTPVSGSYVPGNNPPIAYSVASASVYNFRVEYTDRGQTVDFSLSLNPSVSKLSFDSTGTDIYLFPGKYFNYKIVAQDGVHDTLHIRISVNGTVWRNITIPTADNTYTGSFLLKFEEWAEFIESGTPQILTFYLYATQAARTGVGSTKTYSVSSPSFQVTYPVGSWQTDTDITTVVSGPSNDGSESLKYVVSLLKSDSFVADLITFDEPGAITYQIDSADAAPLLPNSTGGVFTMSFKLFLEREDEDDFLIRSFTINNNLNLNQSVLAPGCSESIVDLSGLYQLSGHYVVGQSFLRVTISPVLKYGASLSKCKVTVNGTYYTSVSFDTDLLSASATSMLIELTDSRGFTFSKTVSLSLIVWTIPQITTFSIHRGYYTGGVWTADDNGNYCKIQWAINVYPLSGENEVELTITAPDGDHDIQLPSGMAKYTASGALYSAASTEQTYTITIELSDSFATISQSSTLSTAGVSLDIKAGGKGVGIGKVSEYENTLDINPNWEVRTHGMTLAEYILSVISEAANGGGS